MNAITNSTLAFYRRATVHMSGLRAEAEDLQGQLASGEKLSRSSDDPVAASRLRSLSRQDRLGEIDAGNAKRASDDLQLTGNALDSIAEDLIRARELALWAASDPLGDEERRTIGQELEELVGRVMSSANALDSSGNALFGGETSGKAYEIDGTGAVVYVGTASSGELDLGSGQTVTRGLTGPEVLNFTTGGTPTDVFAHIGTLAAALQGGAADPAAAARDALTGFDDALDSLTRAQTVAGSRVAWIDVIQERQVDQSFSRAQQMADTGGVDFASTVVELQQILTVLEASQTGFARLSRLSLFDNI
ncbi:flagellar biosynthesis protein FlgL [Alteraurantiacibacter aquimixticola]|uniref:Flagellar biosynthesis protein FlgL n=1 Tax=Alteraurantiacibacter aquimixticola TaxID=2489173 RepID=A0A4T3F923_9SPHN|nr:flagellar biosynthesis protein FlgL [Alteraurantiacibacter aquimixticola]TIX51520.1 flagellar biosynthesis protein FlgL [Alteraurantiacibacter aquimixticola]